VSDPRCVTRDVHAGSVTESDPGVCLWSLKLIVDQLASYVPGSRALVGKSAGKGSHGLLRNALPLNR
jgi:hypothetical protein